MKRKRTDKVTKISEMYKKIVDNVTQIIETGEYTRFLKFCKNFHNYSFNNMVLIYSQMEDATQVAGFKAWQNMGRKIKPGARGLQIMYPIKRKYTKEIEGQSSLMEDTEKKKEVVEYLTFRPTYVFDISQTTGEKLSMIEQRLNNDSMKEFYELLKHFSRYHILEKELYGTCQGYWSPKNKHIVLKKSLSIDDKTSVLLHELTHALYDDFEYKTQRDLSETFVESVAFIVADYFGLDTSMCSFPYITSWAKGDIKIVLELGDKIQKTANDFIKKLTSEFENQNIRIAG
ncbi:MAG: hypothetical protein J6I85_07055 [Clostridia bacterium]|nr:hypothetical protein [Clostridia bacterium]MBP3801758.1 hypothetical protein [Clostridia bacterium]